MSSPEDLKIVITALLMLAVFTGIGFAVTMVAASALLQYRSGATLGRLRDFGTVEFLPGQKWYDADLQMFRELKPARLQWTLNEAELRHRLFRPGFAVLPLLAGMAAVAAALLLALSNTKWSAGVFGSEVGDWGVLPLGGIAATAAPLVFWQGRRFIRSRQEETCQAIIKGSPARWEKISAAAAPQLKALETLSQEVITALEETTGWRFPTAPEDGSRLSRILGGNDDTLRLDYLAVAARYFAGHPRQRWRDDAARVRLAIEAARRGLQKGKQAFPEAAACYWEAVAVGSEAEIVLKIQGQSFVEGSLQRYAMLMDQLFSGSMRTMLAEVACGEDRAEYQGTVAAIRGELEELTAAAEARRMNKTAACLVLGVKPEAEAAEIGRTCRSLLELWRPAGDDDTFAVQRTDKIRRAQAFLKEQGYA